jgi:hypothetical protein
MVIAIHGLLAGALLFGAPFARVQMTNRAQDQVPVAPAALTNSRPEASFAVSPETVAGSPPVLALSFTRVVNPAQTQLQIFVYLSYLPAERREGAPVRIPLGNVTLYPADRPGGFVLRASDALGKLKAAKATDVRLVLEMKRIHPAEPWSQVEVTVAPPQWRTETTSTK